MNDTWTVLAALQWTASFFKSKGCLSPRLDAELLLASVLKTERIQLYVQYQRPLTMDERSDFRAVVTRRAQGEPVQYILGEQEFWSLPFTVDENVLIPRADTEVLVEEALEFAKKWSETRGEQTLRVAELGVGSGAITVALASELPGAHFFSGDVSAGALDIARRNALRNGVQERVSLTHGAGLQPLISAAGTGFHMVVSNPPYITEAEYPELMREVRDWEPQEALVAGTEGLDVIAPLVTDAGHALLDGGLLAIEIGSSHQAADVKELMRIAGFEGLRIRQDYAGHDRVVLGCRRG